MFDLFSAKKAKSSTRALAAVLEYYGIKKNIDIPDSLTKADERLNYVIEPEGIMRRKVTLQGKWYKDAFGPFILFLKDSGDPIALIPDHIYGYKFRNPNTGKFVRANKYNSDIADIKVYINNNEVEKSKYTIFILTFLNLPLNSNIFNIYLA